MNASEPLTSESLRWVRYPVGGVRETPAVTPRALWRAVGRRGALRGLLIHSDRGVQYACEGFRAAVELHGFIQSMSRKGNCWDNAVAESFFRTLKTEWYYHTCLIDINHAERELFEYIEQFYNAQRQHAALGYLSPVAFEAQKLRVCA